MMTGGGIDVTSGLSRMEMGLLRSKSRGFYKNLVGFSELC